MEHPIFSGGKRITGFKINNEGLWEVQIPETNYDKWRFDQLYVNDERAVLAQTPNGGYHTIQNIEQNIWEKGSGRVPEKAQQILTFDEENFNYINQIAANEIENVRFRAYHKWDFTLRYIDKIDSERKTIYTSGKGMKPWNPMKKGGRIIFENFKAALDEPGEWFLNDEGVLFYNPLPGETIDNSVVIAPVLENLISIEGSATDNEFVANDPTTPTTKKEAGLSIHRAYFNFRCTVATRGEVITKNGIEFLTLLLLPKSKESCKQ